MRWLQLRFDSRSRSIRLLIKNHQWRGLRPSILGQDRSETKKKVGLGLSLAGLVFCCEKNGLVTQQLFKYYLKFVYACLGTSLLWRSTATFTYLKVKSSKCLCLFPVVLVLLFGLGSFVLFDLFVCPHPFMFP